MDAGAVAERDRAHPRCAGACCVGRGIRNFCACLYRQLHGAARVRSPLPGGVLSGRAVGRGDRVALSHRDRRTAPLRHCHDVGRRQRRALCARAPARPDRRRPAARSVDRSRRSAQQGRRGVVDGCRSQRHSAAPAWHWRRCSGAAAVHHCIPARRSSPYRGLGDPASRPHLCFTPACSQPDRQWGQTIAMRCGTRSAQ